MKDTENKNLVSRPPVVVIMGHVDHGKTKLLDYIRKTNVAEHEAGGITQRIGAYEIIHKNRKITFIDTPGHETFSKLRARGAKAADIAVLVVAADDGVKPQTIEALEHIKKAGLPFIVAINKIDKPEANVEKVKKELSENDVLVESWGGKIPSVEISAKAGKNISELLDLIELLADMGELKASLNSPAEGIVIETNLDPRRGFVVSLLILDGTLEIGDYILSGTASGKIKILEDFLGNSIEKAFFSSPVSVVGWDELPLVGEKFTTDKIPFTPALKAAKKIGEIIEKSLLTNEKEGGNVIFYIIIKADVQSSAEAIKENFEKMTFSIQESDKPIVKILKSEAGNVSESDFKTALIANAIIIAFNVKIDPAISAYKEKITLISGSIIYDVLDSAKKVIEEKLKPKLSREEIGRLQVLAVFRQEKNRQVVGGKVISGEIVKGVRIEIIRNEIVIGQGRIISLQADKKEVGKVEAGKEAGISVDFGEPKIAASDIIVLFRKLA
ncbi:MAG: translation initiation factor IF-2 [Candidatus Nealsonbacteria bacterium RIFCSPHIGHO2_01_FULL_43_31]|uniref:Translation initiation factor IF-2 n=1 Tax=Candidatus Nealsonbacteria bacterium RIFCSPHIGHO2_01_FULL_43_31 TaxID=1801665 RepID=A0A1G2E107_9BACT|nr:MAG: translation initiation factor IF-2 [Candidatus Nealsonbacteria bacterium RIFCSPHIGHO2_01_FULL_43_31]